MFNFEKIEVKGDPLGKGRFGTVYQGDGDTIIKVIERDVKGTTWMDHIYHVCNEYRMGKVIHDLGYGPKVDKIWFDGDKGLIEEEKLLPYKIDISSYHIIDDIVTNLHKNHIIHGDIRDENVMTDGKIQLIVDFDNTQFSDDPIGRFYDRVRTLILVWHSKLLSNTNFKELIDFFITNYGKLTSHPKIEELFSKLKPYIELPLDAATVTLGKNILEVRKILFMMESISRTDYMDHLMPLLYLKFRHDGDGPAIPPEIKEDYCSLSLYLDRKWLRIVESYYGSLKYYDLVDKSEAYHQELLSRIQLIHHLDEITEEKFFRLRNREKMLIRLATKEKYSKVEVRDKLRSLNLPLELESLVADDIHRGATINDAILNVVGTMMGKDGRDVLSRNLK